MNSQQYALRWTNYNAYVTAMLDSMRYEEEQVDVTLICEGRKVRAHKILLSACSPYFKDVFRENPCQHPVIIFKNVPYADLIAVVDFMYQGEVNVPQEQLSSFLNTAESLSVRGLTENEIDPRQTASTAASTIAQQVLQTQVVHSRPDPLSTTNPLYPTVPSSVTIIQQPQNTPVQTITKPVLTALPSEMPSLSPIVTKPAVSMTPEQKLQQFQQHILAAKQRRAMEQSTTAQQAQTKPAPKETPVQSVETIKLQRIELQDEELEQSAESGQPAGSDFKVEVPEFISVDEMDKSDKFEVISENVCEDAEMEQEAVEGSDTEMDPTGDGANTSTVANKQQASKCSLCKKVFCSANAMKRHKEAKHRATQSSFPCPLCTSCFKTKWSLSTHKSKYHRDSSAGVVPKTEPIATTRTRTESASSDDS